MNKLLRSIKRASIEALFISVDTITNPQFQALKAKPVLSH